MTKLQATIAALGAIATLCLWLLRRYFTTTRKVRILKGKVDEITNEIVVLEKKSKSYSNLNHLQSLYSDRMSLNREIRRLQGK